MAKNIIKIDKQDIKEAVTNSINKCLKEHYSLTDIDELMEYMWLKPNVTGLNVDIFVDDGCSYIRNNHQLLLFARNGYDKSVSEFIAFSVSDNPIILNPEVEYKLSYNDIFSIQTFIVNNLNNLVDLANKNVSQTSFVKQIRIPAYSISENKIMLHEMATLRTDVSHLPMDIWLDEGATYVGHAPRIKFRASHEQHTTREFSSMLLTNPPTIENMPDNSPLKKKDIDKLKEFVVANLELLLQLADGEIDYTTDFLPKMIII